MTSPRPEIDERRLGICMVAPAVIIVAVVALAPILEAVRLSLHRVQLQFPDLGQPFVGLDNYAALAREPRVWSALHTTFTFTLVTVSLELVLGTGLALLLHRAFFGRGLVRAAALVPWAFTTVVAALLWKFMYDADYGIVNALLLRAHVVAEPVAWLASPRSALLSLIVADVWKTTPFMALLILAGLQSIPADVLEAARIDGASPLTTFFRVTLPLLRPTLLVALLFRTLDAFRVFDMVFVLTRGGPGNATESISYLTYLTLFRQFDFGMGSALAVVTFACVLLVSFMFIRVLGARPS